MQLKGLQDCVWLTAAHALLSKSLYYRQPNRWIPDGHMRALGESRYTTDFSLLSPVTTGSTGTVYLLRVLLYSYYYKAIFSLCTPSVVLMIMTVVIYGSIPSVPFPLQKSLHFWFSSWYIKIGSPTVLLTINISSMQWLTMLTKGFVQIVSLHWNTVIVGVVLIYISEILLIVCTQCWAWTLLWKLNSAHGSFVAPQARGKLCKSSKLTLSGPSPRVWEEDHSGTLNPGNAWDSHLSLAEWHPTPHFKLLSSLKLQKEKSENSSLSFFPSLLHTQAGHDELTRVCFFSLFFLSFRSFT